MSKYVLFVLFSFAVNIYSSSCCCEQRERSASYLDIAVDLISKAKLNLPDCEETKEIPKCPEEKAMDCADLYEKGVNRSGIYKIWPVNRLIANTPIKVYCDMDTDGGGWTVIQRRGQFGNPADYFYKYWADYKYGFGDLQKEFWLGNDNIFALTNQKQYSIRFDLKDRKMNKAYANYSTFWIDDESHKYMLHIANYSGDAGNAMQNHTNQNFTTRDQKNNVHASRDCVKEYNGAWWYYNCYNACLNGLNKEIKNGIEWRTWRLEESLIWTEMKIRPNNFRRQHLIDNINS